MSQSDVQQFVVTFDYQERGLSDLLELNSSLLSAGFTTTLNDDQGHPHELGSNRFGFISTLESSEVAALARGLAESVLDITPEVNVTLWPGHLAADENSTPLK